MRSIPFMCLLVFAVSGFYQVVSGLKPRMFPEKDEIILKEGDDLIIQCEGDRWLKFLPEKTPDNPKLEYESSYDEGLRLHEFVFKSVSYLNTAWYACAEAGVNLENNDQIIDHSHNDISWIYVYVKSTKPFPSENPVRLLSVTEGHTAVIPCRPTSPDLEVKLQIDFEDNKDSSIEYVQKVGFLLKNVSVLLSELTYSCVASIPDPDWMEPLIAIHVTPPDPLPRPTIDEKSVPYVVSGRNHTFICYTTADVDSNFVLSWRTPPSVPDSRISQKTFERESISKNYQIKVNYSTELTVRNVEIDDGGEYVCYIAGSNGEYHETSVHITVSAPDPLPRPTIDEKSLRRVVSGRNHTFICNTTVALNADFVLRWKTPQSVPESRISQKTFERESVCQNNQNKAKYSIELTVRNVEIGDGGEYVCYIAGSNGEYNETSVHINVSALDPLPRPTIDEKSVRHVGWGKDHTFICNTTMATNADFDLRWKTPKSVPDSRISQKTFERESISKNYQIKVNYSTELTVRNVEIDDGGEYVCYIAGSNGEYHETSVHITVSVRNTTFGFHPTDIESMQRPTFIFYNIHIHLPNKSNEP